MKPVRLKIKGLNSFLDEQEIDFTQVMRYGFFGIFGPTGSGKTTIIDAITIALYGEVPRYDGDRKSKQFINTNTDTMAVSFEFEIGNDSYIVERTFKNKNDKILANTARIYKNDQDKAVLEEKPSKVNDYVKQMIGLGYDDFTRTVILPQGKFSEFLHLANLERRSMLERIFKLEQYGENLNKRVRELRNEEQNRLDVLDGQMGMIGESSEEVLEQEEALWQLEGEQIVLLANRQKDTEQQYLKVKELKGKVDEQQKYKAIANTLALAQPHIETLEKQWQKAEKANQILPLIQRRKETGEQIKEHQAKYEKVTGDIVQCAQKEEQQHSALVHITKQKEEELPLLQEEKFNLNQAIALEKELQGVQQEREMMVQQFKKEKAHCKQMQQQRTLLAQQKQSLQDDLEHTLVQLQNVKVGTTLRNQIQQGYEMAMAYQEEEKKYHRLLEKQQMIQKQTSTYEQLIITLEKGIQQNKETLQILERKMVQRQQEKLDITVQMTLQKNILANENKYEQMKNAIAEMMKLKEEKNQLAKEIEKTKAQHRFLQSQVTADKEALIQQINAITAMENEKIAHLLRQHLITGKPCPVCGNVVHMPFGNIELDDQATVSEDQKAMLEQRIHQNEVALEKNNLLLEMRQQKMTEQQSRLDQLEGQGGDLEALAKEILSEKQQYEHNQRQMAQWEAEIKQYEQDKKQLEQQCHADEIKRATTQEKLQKDTQTIQEQTEELEGIKTQQQNRADLCQQILQDAQLFPGKMDLFFQWNEKIKAQDKEAEALSQREQKNRLALEENNKADLHWADSQMKSEKELERIQTIGSEKATVIDNLTKKIQGFSSEKDFVARYKVVELRINIIVEEEKNTKQKLEEIQKNKQILIEQQRALDKQIEVLHQFAQAQETELQNKIRVEGFEDESSVLSSLLPTVEQQRIEQQVKQHQEQVVDVNNNLKRIAQLLVGEETAQVAQKETTLAAELQELGEVLEQKKKEQTIREEKIKKMKADVLKMQQFQKERKKVLARFDLLSELVSVLKCKFVEYIATKQLEYITMEASERLKQITNGRYALELDETDFIIRDDFNGGIRRSPKTLSGGETFVTSLCLALALSSHIQLNNQNPLEFFFLDEGFGTLDNTSLEHVISSLERLRMEKINIGIITHSEELKERVPAKIIVTPAKQYTQGSRIIVE